MEKIAVNTSDVSTGKSTGEKVHLPLRCFLPLSGVNHGVGLIHLEEAQKKQWSLQSSALPTELPSYRLICTWGYNRFDILPAGSA